MSVLANEQSNPVSLGRRVRTAEENRERAFIAASKRSDRTVEAKIHSAKRASEIHHALDGKYFYLTETIIVSRDTQYEEIEEEEQLLDPLLLLPDNVTPQDILEELYAIQVEKFYCNYFPSIIIPPTLPPKNMVGLGLTYFTDDSNPSPADVSPPSENTTPMTEELDLSEYECDPNVEPEEGGTTLLAQMEDILGQWNQDYGHDTWSEHGYLSLTAEEFDSYLLKDNNEYEELT